MFHSFEPRSVSIPMSIILLGPFVTLLWLRNSMPSLSQTIQFYVQCLGFLMLSIAGYRVSPLHPLWSFPGPTLAKITKLYGMWLSWTGRQHLVIQDLHTKFGSFVRVGTYVFAVVFFFSNTPTSQVLMIYLSLKKTLYILSLE